MALKVYYLDDEKLLCDLFKEEFESEDIQIFTFIDAQNLIQETKTNPPDVIFLDFRLPGINGDQVAIKIAKGIPIYLVTGDLHIRNTYPFVRIFQKPYEEAEIQKVLQAMVDKKEK